MIMLVVSELVDRGLEASIYPFHCNHHEHTCICLTP